MTLKIRINLLSLKGLDADEILEEIRTPLYEWDRKWSSSSNPLMIEEVEEVYKTGISGIEYLTDIIIHIKIVRRNNDGIEFYQLTDFYDRISDLIEPRSIYILDY